MKYQKFIFFILLIIILFSLFSCGKQAVTTTTTIAEVSTTTTQIITTTETITETIAEETTTTNNDMQLFRDAIKDYNIVNKAFDYAGAVVDIMNDYVDAKTKTLKMTKEEVGTRYMELANKVGKDYFVLPVLKEKILDKSGIQNITPEMKQMISLMIDWQDKVKTQYEYTAKYYYGEGGEYDIKAGELEKEAQKDYDEFYKLSNEK